jgi:hypothetical protein
VSAHCPRNLFGNRSDWGGRDDVAARTTDERKTRRHSRVSQAKFGAGRIAGAHLTGEGIPITRPERNIANSAESRKSEASPKSITNAKIFKGRCEARAILFAIGEYDLHRAVDVLQSAAEASGLVDEVGQDAVQALLAEAFARVR